MKKTIKLVLLSLIIIALVIATIFYIQKNTPQYSENKKESNPNETLPENEIKKEADNSYFIADHHFFHGSKKLADESVGMILTGKDNYEGMFNIWNSFSNGDMLYLLVTFSGERAGTISLLQTYFVIDTRNDSLTLGKFTTHSHIFENLAAQRALPSPDSRKAVFVRRPEDRSFNLPRDESIWIFDFLADKEWKVADIQKGETVLKCEEEPFDILCSIDEGKLGWTDDSQQIVIRVNAKWTSEEQKEKSSREGSFEKLSYLLLAVAKDITILDFDLRQFDFDQDGYDEYILYFQKKLPKPVSFGFEERNWNGAYRIFKRNDKLPPWEWDVLYQDEGTVGYKGYGVYSELKKESFFDIVDIDQDGVPEVRISTVQDGSGGYVDSYILKWNGEKIAKAEIVETKTEKELEEIFLKGEEAFGPALTICPNDSDNCNFRQSTPGSIGKIIYDLKYQNGKFIQTNYRREDY